MDGGPHPGPAYCTGSSGIESISDDASLCSPRLMFPGETGASGQNQLQQKGFMGLVDSSKNSQITLLPTESLTTKQKADFTNAFYC